MLGVPQSRSGRGGEEKNSHVAQCYTDWAIKARTTHQGVSKSFRTESITKYTLTTINTRWEAIQRFMAAKITTLIHKIAIWLHLLAGSCTVCSSRSGWPVRKLLDTPSCILWWSDGRVGLCVFFFTTFAASVQYPDVICIRTSRTCRH